jgi:hypothetical protein
MAKQLLIVRPAWCWLYNTSKHSRLVLFDDSHSFGAFCRELFGAFRWRSRLFRILNVEYTLQRCSSLKTISGREWLLDLWETVPTPGYHWARIAAQHDPRSRPSMPRSEVEVTVTAALCDQWPIVSSTSPAPC